MGNSNLQYLTKGTGRNSSRTIQASRQGRAGVYVLILLTILTLSWIMFIVLHIYDFGVHQHSEEKIMNKLKEHNCSGSAEDELQIDFPKLR